MKNLKAKSKGEERRTFLKTVLAATVTGVGQLREGSSVAASMENPLPELPEG
jgi:hypothetical protein